CPLEDKWTLRQRQQRRSPGPPQRSEAQVYDRREAGDRAGDTATRIVRRGGIAAARDQRQPDFRMAAHVATGSAGRRCGWSCAASACEGGDANVDTNGAIHCGCRFAARTVRGCDRDRVRQGQADPRAWLGWREPGTSDRVARPPMIALPAGVQVWLAAGATDLRKGFDGLSALVQTQLSEDPFSGQLFVFRGRAGDRVKILWWSGDGLCLFAKRLERGHFVWPQATHGTVSLTAAQLSMLLEGIDWRHPVRSAEAPQFMV